MRRSKLPANWQAAHRDRMNEDATVSIDLRRTTLDVLIQAQSTLAATNEVLREALELLRELKRQMSDLYATASFMPA